MVGAARLPVPIVFDRGGPPLSRSAVTALRTTEVDPTSEECRLASAQSWVRRQVGQPLTLVKGPDPERITTAEPTPEGVRAAAVHPVSAQHLGHRLLAGLTRRQPGLAGAEPSASPVVGARVRAASQVDARWAPKTTQQELREFANESAGPGAVMITDPSYQSPLGF